MAAGGLPNGIQISRVSPAYLHGNSTSHTWAFSAVAELIDNAYDPDVNASEMWIDQRIISNNVSLTFVDNGNGMSPDKLHKMLRANEQGISSVLQIVSELPNRLTEKWTGLRPVAIKLYWFLKQKYSFGYCEKDKFSTSHHQAVGQYGNGFKSGSMRLGRDAIVFTRQADSMSVGMLSQTYLTAIHAETVLTPIVTWTLPDKKRKMTSDAVNNLKAICHHSLFRSETSLLEELHVMEKLKTGTKIIIYNLKRRGGDATLELDFSSDPTDIRNPETHRMDFSTINRVVHEQASAYVTSLREYCSILYLKPRMKIVLRGKKVKTKLIQKSLSQTETDVYKPTWAPKTIPIRFGFNSRKNPKDYGVMLYHKNRLIRAYEKVGYQKQPNELGIGVVGVVEAYFLTPTHNKQDFSKDDQYNAFMSNVSQKLNDYWNEKMGTGSNLHQAPQNDAPDWTWAQCDNIYCLKWRRLPIHIRGDDLPEKWFCHMNPDAQFNRCDIEEEPEDDDNALQGPTYIKKYKKHQNEKKLRLKLQEENQLKAMELKLQVKERRLQQLEKDFKKRSEAQGSSSQEKPRNSQEVVKIQMNLQKYQKQAEEQEKIINQLKNQKKLIEDNWLAMKKAAEGLKLVTTKSEAVGESTEVTSTSSKRKDEKICIKTEYGENVNGGPSSAKKPRIASSGTTEQVDIKPDISKIKIEKTEPVKSYKDTGVQTRVSGRDNSENQQRAERQLTRLQHKVFKLLKIIVPDEDIGTPDTVEEIVTEMIKQSSS